MPQCFNIEPCFEHDKDKISPFSKLEDNILTNINLHVPKLNQIVYRLGLTYYKTKIGPPSFEEFKISKTTSRTFLNKFHNKEMTTIRNFIYNTPNIIVIDWLENLNKTHFSLKCQSHICYQEIYSFELGLRPFVEAFTLFMKSLKMISNSELQLCLSDRNQLKIKRFSFNYIAEEVDELCKKIINKN